MSGFFSRLFGGRTSASGSDAPPGEAVDYNGFRIRPAPFRSEGQFQTAGSVEKEFPDGLKEHKFIRAERHASLEEAKAFSLTKGRQIVDEQGDRLFDPK